MKRLNLSYLLVLCASCWIVEEQALADGFTIGGAVYTDLNSPITSGLTGVEVCVECGEFSACDFTEGSWGGWDVSGVPAATCTVTAILPGWCFSHVEGGEIGLPSPIAIVVDVVNEGPNLSLQFLASTGTSYCCVAAEDCDDGEPCTIDECLDSMCLSTPNDCPVDFDCDGFVSVEDLAILLGSWGPCPKCEADLDGDGEVRASDLGILLGQWGPCQ